jgi:hypothetical protein
MTASRINSALRITAAATALAVIGCSSKATGTQDGGFNFGDAMPRDVRDLGDGGITTHDSGHVPIKDGGRISDSGAPPPSDATAPSCNALSTTGAAIPWTAMSGSPPMAVGGTIPTGDYTLVERDYYAAAGAPDGGGGSPFIQQTLVFTADSLAVAQWQGDTYTDAGQDDAATATYSYITVGRTLSITAECPEQKTVINDLYTVVDASAGPQLWLFVDPGGYRSVYAPE